MPVASAFERARITTKVPKLSVCLPTYNGQRHLADAIESVLSQSLEDFELLIADDCSSDGTFDLVEAYARRDSRIRYWCNRRNVGLFQNYNLLINRARGAFIKPFAQDDILERTALERLSDVLEQDSEIALVSGRKIWIDDAGDDITHRATDRLASEYFCSDKAISGNDVILTSLLPVVNFIGEPSTVLFRAADPLFEFDPFYHHLGDLDLWLRILRTGDFYFIDERICRFRMHPGSQSSANFANLLFLPDVERVWGQFSRLLLSYGVSREEFLETAMSHIADFLHAESNGKGDWSLASASEPLSLHSSGSHPSLPDEALVSMSRGYRAFREVAFHSLCLLGMTRATSYKLALLGVSRENINRLRQIRLLEKQVRLLLESPSWRSTRLLRDWNRKVSGRWQPAMRLRAGGGTLEEATEQERYLRYLQRTIRKIRRSRSWKITSPLRALSRVFD